jgi:hypothetical protein
MDTKRAICRHVRYCKECLAIEVDIATLRLACNLQPAARRKTDDGAILQPDIGSRSGLGNGVLKSVGFASDGALNDEGAKCGGGPDSDPARPPPSVDASRYRGLVSSGKCFRLDRTVPREFY